MKTTKQKTCAHIYGYLETMFSNFPRSGKLCYNGGMIKAGGWPGDKVVKFNYCPICGEEIGGA